MGAEELFVTQAMLTTVGSCVSARWPCASSTPKWSVKASSSSHLHLQLISPGSRRPSLLQVNGKQRHRSPGVTWVGWLGTVLTIVGDTATMLKVGACRLEFRPPVMRAKE
jgi:hypothetical protein